MCNHKNTTVTNSRHYGVTSGGYLTAKKNDFDYMIYRMRRCDDCGQKISTYELSLEQINLIKRDKSTVNEILSKMNLIVNDYTDIG